MWSDNDGLDVLRRHCETVGRDYDEIEKTVMGPLDPGADGEKIDDLVAQMATFAELGVTHYHGSVPNPAAIIPIELLGKHVVPAAAGM